MRGRARRSRGRSTSRWSRALRATWPLRGRDPEQAHRASTPLELLFDLSAVVAFDQIAQHVGDSIAAGSLAAAGIGLGGATFAVCWAWINYTWLASAYDSDDVLFRVATLLELIGVLIVAVGVAPLFESISAGRPPDTALVVVGYVVMRVTAVALWLRVVVGDPPHRTVALAYAGLIPIVQAGWVLLAITRPQLEAASFIAAVLGLAELGIPAIAEARGPGTPWHPAHVAERYGLLAIIALGEVLTGAADAAIAVLKTGGPQGIAIGVLGAGAMLAFTSWWLYFTIPSAAGLRRFRRTAFSWGYIHIALFASIIGMGASFHLAAARVSEGDVETAPIVAMAAFPVGAFSLAVFVVHALLVRRVRASQTIALAVTGGLLLVAVLLAGAAAAAAVALVALAPLALVFGAHSGDYGETRVLSG